MKYNLSFEICTLLFLSLILIVFFYKKKFPNKKNTFFTILLIFSYLNIILDLLSSYLIMNYNDYSLWIQYAVNEMYYIVQLSMALFFYFYAMCIAQKCNSYNKKTLLISLLPYFIFVLLILFDFYTSAFFYYKDGIYYHGMYYYCLFIVLIFYFILGSIYLFRKKYKVSNEIKLAIILFNIIISIAMLWQYFHPSDLVCGVGIGLGIVIMYFLIQNPEEMLDDLTGLFNRNAFSMYLDEKVNQKSDFYIINLAIDEMKVLNDIFGEKVGNIIIQNIANYLKEITKTQLLFRHGGDQFAIITKNEKKYYSLVNELKNRFYNAWELNDKIKINISICMGYGNGKFVKSGVIEPVIMIEKTMQLIKGRGKGTYLEMQNDIYTSVVRESSVELALRNAIHNKSLEVHYQPLFDLKDNEYSSMEALVRLHDDYLGNISPAEFIPIAENKGLIVEIGQLVLTRVCKDIIQYHLYDKKYLKTIKMNLSTVELLNHNLVNNILDIVDQYEVDHSMLNFEITETAASSNQEIMKTMMYDLKERGFSFSLDDFGVGYSNLDRVFSLPFKNIKFDRSMLLMALENADNRIVFEEMVIMMKRLGLFVIVEGVETKKQLDFLCKMDIDYIQGFYYCRPQPITNIIEIIK